jgi:hypothetical protein
VVDQGTDTGSEAGTRGGCDRCIRGLGLAAVAAAVSVALLVACATTRPPTGTTGMSAAGRANGPAIHLDRDGWDFGTIERGETITMPLTIANVGSESLLVALRTSCECFTVSRESLTVGPRQAESVMLTLQGPVVKDPTTKTLYVDSNDPTTPRVTFVVKGAVKAGRRPHLAATPDPAPITPPRGRAGSASASTPDSAASYLAADILIENRGREDLTITQIRFFGCTGDWTEAVIAGGGSSVLYVESLPDWSGQRWLEIDSNDPIWPLKKIVLVEME